MRVCIPWRITMLVVGFQVAAPRRALRNIAT